MLENGAILLDKHAGISSFGIIELLQRELCARTGVKRRDLPKIGHGGTLDPFATGLLVICLGDGVKLARYFLGSDKTYEGRMRFGETTVPGDPTAEISERSAALPDSIESVREMAHRMTLQPYLQVPPMHSAKKFEGKPMYEYARQGIEIEREPKLCQLYSFEISNYDRDLSGEHPVARSAFRTACSSGTYIRVLSQDLGKMLGTVGMLDTLRRTASGIFNIANAFTMDQLVEAGAAGKKWHELPCFVPFDRMLDGYERAQATPDEADALVNGRQQALFNVLKRTEPAPLTGKGEPSSRVAIYDRARLVAVACHENGAWGLERVFARSLTP